MNGARQLKEHSPIRVLDVVESPFSVMRFHQLGLPAVALFGSSVSERQAEILGQLAKGVVYRPNRNKHREAMQCAAILAGYLWVKMPEMPKEDPEELSLEEIKTTT